LPAVDESNDAFGRLQETAEDNMAAGAPRRPRSWLGFYPLLTVIALGALIGRLAYDFALRHQFPAPDGLYYLIAARLNQHGRWFANPFTGTPAAFHPPLWTLVLTIPPFLGAKSTLYTQDFASLIGVATVVAVGFAGRRITSDRGGLIAALIAASYPGLWVYERSLLSETLLSLGVAVTIIATYRYLAGPTRWRAVVLGLLCGLLALTRSEQVLLVPALLVPLILGWRWRAVSRRRIESLILACFAVLVVAMPWTLFNVGRPVDGPVFLSTSFGSAMAQGNCDSVYYGKNLGYLEVSCQAPLAADAVRRGSKNPFGDSTLRNEALRYMREHLSRVPLVLIAREGRAWSFYKPFETAKTQYQFPRQPRWPQGFDLFYYWSLLPIAVSGGVLLRRRGVSLLPLIAPFVITVVAVALTYGDPRLRAGAEVPLVLLAAVGIERLTRIRERPGQPDRVSSVKNSS
jgi:4-amino-4-deoxy-L-arabinose transferase-like glycosyltransferase